MTKQYKITISGEEFDVEMASTQLKVRIKKMLEVLDLTEFSIEEVKE